jgi:hypothetical protein
VICGDRNDGGSDKFDPPNALGVGVSDGPGGLLDGDELYDDDESLVPTLLIIALSESISLKPPRVDELGGDSAEFMYDDEAG